HNGYAIHGSYDIAQLGGPASHGCVRLHPQDAALLFAMVKQEGPANTTIVVDGDRPPGPSAPRYRGQDAQFGSAYRGNREIARGAYAPGPSAYRDGEIARGAYAPGPSSYRGDGEIARGAYAPGPSAYRDGEIARGAYAPGPSAYRGDDEIARGAYAPGP